MQGGDVILSRLAFAALVAGLGILAIAVVWAGSVYPGYDHARQFMSELGASGAVTGAEVSRWGFVPNGLLITVFSVLAAWILRRSALAVTACLLLAGNGIGMTGAGIYPCDFECSRSDPSAAALLHDLFGGLGYLNAIVGVGLAALWARQSEAPWLAPLGVGVLIVSLVGFYGVVAEVALMGLFQRAMEAALAVFMLALGWALVKGLRAARP
ncbi:MAG: DUF998 domain-containing protein [Brevundimonas sp.]|uniref:DUF998 domain-containing protein n=1 Tax=Brevundimonas sp. TaxID=1871086 RepID=UPI00277748E1|nr:DUF998 domain-containing protein [Brevundimonas sp.]MDP3401107.1 DUF998 domain-containing protein [Brevundimonas sp.]MDZ4110602.1 DUF998 domain-containing protein [Brevundimonas sp.]